MKIKKKDYQFPEELTKGSEFADDVNNVFPIDTEDSIITSAKYLRENIFGIYGNKEKLLIMDRIIDKGKQLGIASDIKKDVSEYFGGIMYTKEQLDEAVASALENEKEKHLKALDELKADFAKKQVVSEKEKELNKEIEKLKKEIEKLKEEKEKVEKKSTDAIEKAKKLEFDVRVRDRVMYLSEAFADINIDKEDKEKYVKEILDTFADNGDDEKFETFVKSQIEFIKKISPQKKEDLADASQTIVNPDDDNDLPEYRKKIEKRLFQI